MSGRIEVPTAAVPPVVPAQAVGIEPRHAHLAPEPVMAVPAPAPAGLVLAEDLHAGEPVGVQSCDAPAEQEPEPALSSPGSLGSFA